MYHLLKLLLLQSLYATIIHANDINNTNEIISEPTITIPTPIVNEAKGDPIAGRNIFKYVLKNDCNITAHKFAAKYSQEEWEELAQQQKIKETIFKFCPNSINYYQDKWTDDLYKFLHDNSNDEEGIPEC